MIPETTYAWAAGVFDGEGYAGMTQQKPGRCKRRTISFQPRLVVQMAHKTTIELLHSLFGGSFSKDKPRDASKHRVTYKWIVSDIEGVRNALSRMLPYLVTKREQAQLILSYLSICRNPSMKRPSDSLTTLRIGFFERLKELNRRGIKQ